jgi:hypothetical protein
MFGLNKLWAAFARLAGEVEALVTTTAEINAGIRAQLRLDGPEGPVEQLVHRGEVIDQPKGPARKGKGRKKATA